MLRTLFTSQRFTGWCWAAIALLFLTGNLLLATGILLTSRPIDWNPATIAGALASTIGASTIAVGCLLLTGEASKRAQAIGLALFGTWAVTEVLTGVF